MRFPHKPTQITISEIKQEIKSFSIKIYSIESEIMVVGDYREVDSRFQVQQSFEDSESRGKTESAAEQTGRSAAKDGEFQIWDLWIY